MRKILSAIILMGGIMCAAPGMAAAGQSFADALASLQAKKFTQAMSAFSALAETGHGRAEFMLGVMHEQGLGVAKNARRAAGWYLRAAQHGNASAQYNIAVFHQLGKGVERSDAAALKWHAAAAAQGHHKAQNNLGAIFYTGAGVARNLVEAWKWLTLAADGLTGQDRKVTLQNRGRIERDMTADALAEAKRRAAAFKAR
jgi:uncharacterized protein